MTTDALSVDGSIRYNDDNRTFDNCAITNTDHFARYFDIFQSLANGGIPIVPLSPGDCYVLDPANHFRPVSDIHKVLNQNSVPWRVGIDWKAQPGILLYANVSRGFKAGTVPVVGAATVSQFKPVPQESVMAYEMGFKATLLDDHLQFNAAAFYYADKDKQLRGSLLDPAFGPLEALVSIPKSHVQGAEMQLIVTPLDGLKIDTSMTYLETAIDQFTGYDAFANYRNLAGTPYPFAPKWISVTDISYERQICDNLDAFIGGTLTHNSKTFSGVGALEPMRIDPFTTINLRAGVETEDGRYRVELWGQNVTNEYYWTSVFAYGNSISRYLGNPRTYGVQLSYRFQ